MKRIAVCSAVFGLLVARVVCIADPSAADVPEWNRKVRRNFAEQRFGIFIHWGLYSAYAQGESYLNEGKLDESAYARMMHGFCPSKFDARAWVRVFKEAGARYVTITSRHHDGFSLWPTKVDDGYNIALTPFKRDIIGELAEACRAEGLQLNLYYSTLDWHRRDYPPGKWTKNVNLPDRKPDYRSYKRFMMSQIAELIDNYHPGCMWFDGEWEHCIWKDGKVVCETLDWEYDDIYDLIHARHVLVANNNHRDIRPKEDIQLFERDLPGENQTGFSAGQPVVRDRPLEQCDVLQKGCWGYRVGVADFRTAPETVAMVVRAAAKGANILMNVGPDASGQLPEKAVATLRGVGRWFAKNGESIYGTDAGGVSLGKQVVSTRKGRTLYLHFLDPKVTTFALRTVDEPSGAVVLADGRAVSARRVASGMWEVVASPDDGSGFDRVVKVDFK